MKDQEYEAVYEGGVFKPVGQVSLPELTRVVVRPYVEGENEDPPSARKAMAASLSRSYETGQSDLAQRHNEHQP